MSPCGVPGSIYIDEIDRNTNETEIAPSPVDAFPEQGVSEALLKDPGGNCSQAFRAGVERKHPPTGGAQIEYDKYPSHRAEEQLTALRRIIESQAGDKFHRFRCEESYDKKEYGYQQAV